MQGFIDQQKHPVETTIIDARAITSVDFSVLEKLRPYFQKLEDQGIKLAIARVHLPLRGMELGRGMDPIFSEDRVFVRVSDAVKAFSGD